MRKKRVLWSGESSYLNTGYAIYAHEVLTRLHATGKYDILELGTYGQFGDPRARQLPWKYIHVNPDAGDQGQVNQFNSCGSYQFGEWKFEEACLAHHPDIIIDVRDWWMFEYQNRSVFRHHFNWAVMPTVDSVPLDEQWLMTYQDADSVFTYSDWGMEVLKKQTRGRINGICSAPPGADLSVLRPKMDRRAHRREMGIDEDCFVVGTVMRNQARKLYPDLIQAFARFLKKAPPDLAKKTFLYLHTCWPDLGWDIPRLLIEEGVGHKTVMTYHCQACKSSFPAFFSDGTCSCKKCGAYAAALPSSESGITTAGMAEVLNLFDIYVQYASNEGFGMPLVEAAACGVPVMAVDYSAMSDVVRKLGGSPIPVQRMFRDPSTHCWRALPDNEAFVDLLIQHLSLPEPVRARKGHQARQAMERCYNYDHTASLWASVIDSAPDSDGSWSSPSRARQPNQQVPEGLSNEQFVSWGLANIACRPELVGSYGAIRLTRDLNRNNSACDNLSQYFNGCVSMGEGRPRRQFGRNEAVKVMMVLNGALNHWETRRTAK